jgi:hypothetical protein
LVSPVPGTAKVSVTVRDLRAASEGDAKNEALDKVRAMIPSEGYVVSNPTIEIGNGQIPAEMAGASA